MYKRRAGEEEGGASDHVEGLTAAEGAWEGRRSGCDSLSWHCISKKGLARPVGSRQAEETPHFTKMCLSGRPCWAPSLTEGSLQDVWPQCTGGDGRRWDSSSRLSVSCAPAAGDMNSTFPWLSPPHQAENVSTY